METNQAVVSRRQQVNGGRVIIGMIAGALLLQALLRMWVAIDLLRNAGIEGELGAMVHWRVFDTFTGWVGLMILALADAAEGSLALALRWTLALGLAAVTVSLLWGEVGGVAILDIVMAGLLAIAGVLLVGRQMLQMARSTAGVDIEQLWRGVALQWVLLWIAAEVVLRIRFWKEGVESEERARMLVFLLPVVGMLPNVMMAMGIRWWSAARARGGALAERAKGRVKVRAWMVGLISLNLGAACVIAAEWIPWLGIAGAALMIVGVGMYLLGFPRGAWRVAGKMVPAAFGLLVLGLAMMGAERIAAIGSGGSLSIPMLYSASWRHILASVVVLWLLGMGGLALATLVDERVRAGTRGAVMASGFMIVLGVFATAGTMLAGIESRDVVQGLFVGAGLELFGVVVAAAAAMRGGRGVRN